MARIVNALAADGTTRSATATPAPTLGEKVRALRREADALEAQQRAELQRLITTTFSPGAAFTANQLWQQEDVQAACLDAGISTPQQLGIWLRSGFTRLYRDDVGVLWTVDANERQEDAGILPDPVV